MGLFNFRKKEKTKVEEKEVVKDEVKEEVKGGLIIKQSPDGKKVIGPSPEEKAVVDRLCKYAGNTIAMLKKVLTGPQGTDLYIVTLYASGLAGIACHETVKALGKSMTVVETKDGKKFYMGDELNKYLHENMFAVTRMVRAVTETPEDVLMAVLKKQTETLGTEQFKVSGGLDPYDLYKNVKNCWNGIFDNMTKRYCESPEEWPIFFAIVLQNVVKESMELASKEEIFNTVAEVACALSKMDDDSLA